ncbi:LOW QUALITY PROTEIN: hypothetical protein V2J09_000383 [Rumex salicifolius]
MISTKNLVKLARKWRKIAVASRKRISLSRTNSLKSSSAAEKGQFVVYTIDERRFVLPLAYLESQVVRELLRMAEEEFGLGGDGHITLPCDAGFMEYAISMIQQTVAKEMEEALILSLSDFSCLNSASTQIYVVQQVFLHMHDPRNEHLLAIKRILRYLRGTTSIGLTITPGQIDQLIAYSNADWVGCPDSRLSTSGYCVFLGPNLVSWSSKLQPIISRSSVEAEYRGVANAIAEACWLCSLLSSKLQSDNVSAMFMSSNPIQHQRTKHIEIDIHFIREKLALGEAKVLHVPTTSQFADILTNGLPFALFKEFQPSLCLHEALMISTKKLIKMAKKWQRMAAASRKKISTERASVNYNGHFVVYTVDARRFALPLAFLESSIFRELLRMAEEEFGLAGDGPKPCDSVLFEYALSVIQQCVGKDLEQALLLSVSQLRCSSFDPHYEQIPISSCC